MTLENIAPYLVGLFALFLVCLAIRDLRIMNHAIAKIYRELECTAFNTLNRQLTQQELDWIWEEARKQYNEQRT